MKKCEKGNCKQMDYEYYDKYPKKYSKDKKFNVIKTIDNTENLVENNQDWCDSCLTNEYNIDIQYDALDGLGMSPLMNLDDALNIIRNLRTNFIYVVRHVDSGYEGSYERNVCAFTEEKKANLFVELATNEAIRLDKERRKSNRPGSEFKSQYDEEFEGYWSNDECSSYYSVEKLKLK